MMCGGGHTLAVDMVILIRTGADSGQENIKKVIGSPASVESLRMIYLRSGKGNGTEGRGPGDI